MGVAFLFFPPPSALYPMRCKLAPIMPANGSADAARVNTAPRLGRDARLSAKENSVLSLPSLTKGRKQSVRKGTREAGRGHGSAKRGWDGRDAYNPLPSITLRVEQLFSSDWFAAEQEQTRRAVQAVR